MWKRSGPIVRVLRRGGGGNGSRRYSTAPPKGNASTFLNYAVAFSTGLVGGTVFLKSSGVGGKDKQNLLDKSTTPIELTIKPKYGDKAAQDRAYNEITQLLGTENVTTVAEQLKEHADTYWSSHRAREDERPGIVVFPSSTEQVSEIMKIAHKYKVPVTPFSGGTSLEGHFTPTHGGICIDFGKMDKILHLHKDDMDVVVQPGVGWEGLNDYLSDYDVFFPPDPGPGAEIGGMIGTSCSGTNAARYGTMKENVLSLTVVLADGTIVKTKQRPRKSSAGYNLTGMFIGSEGTLGIVTEATLKLQPKPRNLSVGVVAFESIGDATNVVARVIQEGIQVGAVELMDDKMMQVVNEAKVTERTWAVKPTLFFKFSGTKATVEDEIKTVKKLAKEHGCHSFDFAKTQDDIEELWSARKNALWSTLDAAPTGYAAWTTDVCVPVSKLTQVIEETQEDMRKSGVLGTILGHVGDGNFHAIITYDPKSQYELAEGLVHRMVKRALKLEGTCTGEHGVGLGKKEFLIEEMGAPAVDTMRRVKQALDPHSLLNPDKVISL